MFFPRLGIVLMVQLIFLNCSWVRCSECSNGDYVADPFDCSAFLQCQFGRWVRRNCPPGLHFNRENIVCDFQWNANCVIDSTSTTTLQPTTITQPPSPTDTTIETTITGPPTTTPFPTTSTPTPFPTSTTTLSPTTTTTFSPTTTTTFSPTTTTTFYPTTTTLLPTTSTTPSPTSTTTVFPMPPTFRPLDCPRIDGLYVVHLPHPNCSMFYKCVHGIPHEMLCQQSQHWAMLLDRCELESEANCVDGAAHEQSDARPPNYW